MTTMTLDTMFTTRAPTRPLGRAAHPPRPRRGGRGGALLVAFAIGVFVTAAGSVATQQPGTPEPTKIVQVGTGDTLWDIAASLADDGDVRAVMEEIEQLNALDSGVLQAGQRLVVPAG